jgi:heme/copper-type cytochrome/quinol oxidase subunit 2
MVKIKLWFRNHPLWLTSFFAGLGLLSMTVANAQTNAPPVTVTTAQELTDLICNFIAYFFWIILVVSVIMVLLAAFDYVTAGDDAEKTTRGRKRLTYAAVGIAVALIATGVPAIVSSLFPQAPNASINDACSIF